MESARVLNLIVRAYSGGVASVFMGLAYWLNSLAMKADSLYLSLVAVGGAIGGLGYGAIKFALDSAKSAMDFDYAMRRILTITETTKEGFEKLKDSVLRISREVPISVEDLAMGLYDIKSVVEDDAMALGLLELAAKGATLAHSDLQSVTKMLSTAVVAYGGNLENAKEWMDQVTMAVSVGRGEYEDYANAMAQLIGFSNMMGIQFYELADLFAFMTRRGYNAANATTFLRNDIMKIIKPSAAAKEEFKKLGIEWGENAVRAAGGLIPYLQNLGDSIGWNTDKLANLFPNLRALPPLFAMAADTGGDLEYVMQKVAESSGTLEERFKLAMEGPREKLQILSNKFGEIRKRIGFELIPIFVKAASFAEKILDRIIAWIDKNPELFRFYSILLLTAGVISMIAGVVSAAVGALMIFGKITGMSLVKLSGLFSILLVGIGAISPAIAEQVQKFIDEIGKLPPEVSAVADEIKGKFSSVGSILLAIASPSLIGAVLRGFGRVKTFLVGSGGSTGLVSIIQSIGSVAASGFSELSASIVPVALAVLALISIIVFLKNNWEDVSRVAKEMVGPTFGELKNAFDDIRSAIKPLIDSTKELWDAIEPILEVIGGFLVAGIVAGLGSLIGFIRETASSISSIAGMVSGFIGALMGYINLVGSLFQYVYGLITGSEEEMEIAREKIQKAVDKIWSSLSKFASNVAGLIPNAMASFGAGFLSWMSSLYESVTGNETPKFITDLQYALENFSFEGAINAIKSSVLDGFEELKKGGIEKLIEFKDGAVAKFEEFRDNAIARIKKLVEEEIPYHLGLLAGKAVKGLITFVTQTAERLKEWKDTAIKKVKEFVEEAPAKIKEFIDNAPQYWSQFKKDVEKSWNEIKSKFGEKVDQIIKELGRIPSYILSLPGQLLTSAKKAGSSFLKGFLEGLEPGSPIRPIRELMAIDEQARVTAANVRNAAKAMIGSISGVERMPFSSGVYTVGSVQVVRHEVVFSGIPDNVKVTMTGQEIADLLNNDPRAMRSLSRGVTFNQMGEIR